VSQELPMAEHGEMDRRVLLANEFFEVTGAELIPIVTDEATWYAFDYLDDAELAATVQLHYGVTLDKAVLRLPFWQFLDYIDKNRFRTDG
jgi:hypothetical protein